MTATMLKYLTAFLLTALPAICVLPSAFGQENSANSSDELFLFRPNTPERQVRGAILAESLDRPGLAAGYLQDLVQSRPTPEVLLKLRSEFGIGTFLKLSSNVDLQPVSKELFQLINEASRQSTPDAVMLESLVQELGLSPEQTLNASLKILSAGSGAVEPLLAADPATPQGELAGQLLKKYVRRLRDGLVTALPNASPGNQVRILELLADSGNPEIAPQLLAYAWAQDSAVAAAARSAIQRVAPQTSLQSPDAAVEGLVREALELTATAAKPWADDRAVDQDRRYARVAADESLEYGTGYLQQATRLLQSAQRIQPESPQVLAATLVVEQAEQGWPAAWPADVNLPAAGQPPAEPDEQTLLAFRMAAGTQNPAAVLGLLRQTDKSLAWFQAHPADAQALLKSGDPRVRLLSAALLHTAGLATSRTRETISTAVQSPSLPQGLAIDSRFGEAVTSAAVLKDMKMAASAATTGQEGFDKATQMLSCDLILIHSNCLRWTLSHTIANLRADYRTATVPIVIYGPLVDLTRTQTTRSLNSGVWFQEEPISDLTLADTLRLTGVPGPVLTEDERRQMIQFARSLN
ncbi:MAG: hypothetical protein R3C49_17720 [Planctomycetaceae bacterium]